MRYANWYADARSKAEKQKANDLNGTTLYVASKLTSCRFTSHCGLCILHEFPLEHRAEYDDRMPYGSMQIAGRCIHKRRYLMSKLMGKTFLQCQLSKSLIKIVCGIVVGSIGINNKTSNELSIFIIGIVYGELLAIRI